MYVLIQIMYRFHLHLRGNDIDGQDVGIRKVIAHVADIKDNCTAIKAQPSYLREVSIMIYDMVQTTTFQEYSNM